MELSIKVLYILCNIIDVFKFTSMKNVRMDYIVYIFKYFNILFLIDINLSNIMSILHIRKKIFYSIKVYENKKLNMFLTLFIILVNYNCN